MKEPNILISLKNLMAPDAWHWLLTALRQDKLVWENVTSGGLGRRLLFEKPEGLDPSLAATWSPAALALFDLRQTVLVNHLASDPMQPIPAALRHLARRALTEWENAPARAQPPVRLGSTGLLALGLRERYLEVGWSLVWQELEAAALPFLPFTSIACLYGIVNSPVEMLATMLLTRTTAEERDLAAELHTRKKLVIHAILSQPASPEVQAEDAASLLKALAGKLSLAGRLSSLEALARRSPAVGVRTAALVDEQGILDEDPSENPSNKLNSLQKQEKQAVIRRLRGEYSEALNLLDKSLIEVRKIQAALAARLAESAAAKGDTAGAIRGWRDALRATPESSRYAGKLALALLDAGREDEARTWLSGHPSALPQSHLSGRLAETLLSYKDGNLEQAREAAKDMATTISTERNEDDESFIDVEELSRLAKMLLDLKEYSHAEKAADLALQQSPSFPPALEHFARATLLQNNPSKALGPALLAASIPGSQPVSRRLLVECLEALEEWQAALSERMMQLERSQPLGGSLQADLCNAAYCAIQANQPQVALRMAQHATALEPNSGEAHKYLGQAQAALGDETTALEHFRRATRLIPEDPGSWLALASAYERTGQSGPARESLRAGALALPESAEIQLALGEALLSSDTPTAALPHLKHAYELAPKKSRLVQKAALLLGKTLFQLRHLEEALRVLEPAYTASENQPDPALAHVYAQTLLALDREEAALGPLETALRSEPQEPEPYLDFARAALRGANGLPSENGLTERALTALEQALAIDPNQHEARALLAEVQAAGGDLLSASETFRRVLESSIVSDPAWRARMSAGLGRVSLSLGRYETAVAALHEAEQAAPESAPIKRSLGEALLAAGLEDDALCTAREALAIDPTNVESLAWFSDLVLKMQPRSSENTQRARLEVITALERAVRLASDRGDLVVRLALVQESIGDTGSARSSLVQLAGSLPTERPIYDLALTPAIVFEAARALRRLGEPGTAVRLLEKLDGIALDGAGDDVPTPVTILSELAEAQRESGDTRSALRTLDNSLALDPQSVELHLARATLLANLNQREEALAGLERALSALTETRGLDEATRRQRRQEIHIQAARLLRQTGEVPRALAHAEAAALLESKKPGEAHCLAACLARGLILNERASKWASTVLAYENGTAPSASVAGSKKNGNEKSTLPRKGSNPERAACACLAAEMAIESGGFQAAADALTQAAQWQTKSPRLKAAQARLAYHRNEDVNAKRFFQEALTGARSGDLSADPARDWRSIAEAALDLQEWAAGQESLTQALRIDPNDPFARLLQVRLIVEGAEVSRLAKKLDVVAHKPATDFLSSEMRSALEEHILILRRLAGSAGTGGLVVQEPAGETKTDTPEVSSALLVATTHWLKRGRAVFQPTIENARALAANAANEGAEEVAAAIAAFSELRQNQACNEAAQSYPNHPAVILQLSLAQEETQPRLALGTAYRLIELFSENNRDSLKYAPYAYYLLARLAHHTGARAADEVAARQAVQAAVELWPDEPRWHALAARIFTANHPTSKEDMEYAIQSLEEAVTLEPSNPELPLQLGLALMNHPDPAEAVEVLLEASQRFPNNGEILQALAQAQRRSGDSQAAAVSAEQAIENLGDPTPALLLRGEIALEEGNGRSALSRAQAVLRIHAEDTRALQLLAHGLQAMGKPAEALETLERAIPLVTDPLPLKLERIHMLRQAQGDQKALQALEKLADVHPDDPRVLSALAELQLETGDSEKALLTARMALQIGGERLSVREAALLHDTIGRQMRRAGQLDSAVHHLTEAIRSNPQSLETYLELGQAHLDRRQYIQALEVYKQAMGITRTDPRPYYQAGLALKEAKDYVGAENMLRRAAALAPTDLSIHRQLGAVVALNLVHNRVGL